MAGEFSTDNQQVTKGFGDRLATAVISKGNPVIVGLDPRADQLPSGLWKSRSPRNVADVADAYHQFCREVIDVVAPLVPAVKPQMAFFEELGPPGSRALYDVVRYARSRGLLVILDGKRSDIASTAEAYARAYLAPSEISSAADALTVSPYLGDDSLEPFVSVANGRGAGVFVLVKTSNPGSGRFQELVADGRPIYLHVAGLVEELAGASTGQFGFGAVGGVVGATYPEMLQSTREAMPHAWILVPGYGSQGGKAEDIQGAFDERGLGAVVNNSRGIIFAHRRPEYAETFGESRWQDAVAAATSQMIDDLRSNTATGRLSAPSSTDEN